MNRCKSASILFSILSIFTVLNLPDRAEAYARATCAPVQTQEEYVYRNDFDWNMSLVQVLEKFKAIYPSGKRLKSRAHFNARSGHYEMTLPKGGVAKIDPGFLASVTRHIETALQRGYAEAIIFPDMGHSHFFVPEEDYKEISTLETFSAESIEKMMSLRSLKVLYHTAEQIELKDSKDSWSQWRYYTRNIVGDNRGGQNLQVHFAKTDRGYNTVRQIEGYVATAGGFNLSASENGCFPYQHGNETRYFDLSLESLPALPYPNREEEFRGKSLLMM